MKKSDRNSIVVLRRWICYLEGTMRVDRVTPRRIKEDRLYLRVAKRGKGTWIERFLNN